MSYDASKVISHTAGDQYLTPGELALIPTPAGTATHRPVPHIEIVQAVKESLGYRQIGVVNESYAVSKDGARMFGVLKLESAIDNVRFALGLRNAHDKSMRLSMVAGYEVFVCTNLAFSGEFQPLLHKHTKGLDLKASIAIGVDQIQRNFEPLTRQIEAWQKEQLADEKAKLIIYKAFVEKAIELPHHLDAKVHDLYFNPQYPEFQPRTLWSLSNAFTSAFKELEPVPQMKATAALAGFLDSRVSDIRVVSIEPLTA